MPPKSSKLFRLYCGFGKIFSTLSPLYMYYRIVRGKEDRKRKKERYGYASLERPQGSLIWIHAASVGETLAALPLISAMEARSLNVLLTTGTFSSAELARTRLSPFTQHQYMPLDTPAFIERFLDHWRPDLALFVESELWPYTMHALHKRAIAHILVNARLSKRSYKRWLGFSDLVRNLFESVSLCLAQTHEDAKRFAHLGAPCVYVTGNLKFDTPPPPANEDMLKHLRQAIGLRPLWLAASTHEGEDGAFLDAHMEICQNLPNLLTIIAPRHPARAASIQAEAEAKGLIVARRSKDQPLTNDTQIYLADTIGEMGLFYRISPLCVLGGSFIPHGGQNPIEPARLDTTIIHGPHIDNFKVIYQALDDHYGALRVERGRDLGKVIGFCLTKNAHMAAMAGRAKEALQPFEGALDETLEALEPFLSALTIRSELEGARQ